MLSLPRGKTFGVNGLLRALRRKYTGDVAIAVPGNADCQYLNTDHHAGIISKEKFEAVELEMAARSNLEVGEDGTVKRKSKKYSSKGKMRPDY